MKNALKQVWYVCGPMSNLPHLNFPAFHAEAARLRALGYEVINPAEINDEDPDAVMAPAELAEHWKKCMRADIKQLMDCDAISMLPGWYRSRGATLEHHIAEALGMRIEFAPGVSPWAAVDAAPDWPAA